jgi:hypothetical protein
VKNRKRETCTSGSVRGGGGNTSTYSANLTRYRAKSAIKHVPRMAKTAAKEATSERFVGATELAQRIDISRPYINKLESEGVLRRTPKGFPLDASVIDYIRYLRRERPPSPRAAADAELAKAKARWLELRVMEKEKTLMDALGNLAASLVH